MKSIARLNRQHAMIVYLPVVVLNGGHRPTIINCVNLCRENYGCILIKRRNEFKIVDD